MTGLIHKPKQIFHQPDADTYYGVERKQKIFPDWQVFLPLILTEPPSKLRKWRRRKKTICCKQRHRCCNYRCRSTTIIKVFASGPWEILTELRCELAAEKQMPIRDFSRTISNSFQLNLTSCKHRHLYYIGIIQIFEQLQIFLKAYAYVKSNCARVLHDFTHD